MRRSNGDVSTSLLQVACQRTFCLANNTTSGQKLAQKLVHRMDDLQHLPGGASKRCRAQMFRRNRVENSFRERHDAVDEEKVGHRYEYIDLCNRQGLCNNNCPLYASRTPAVSIQTILIRAGRMLPILRPIPRRRAIPQPILQKAIARPPLKHPIEVGIIRDSITSLLCRVSIRIVLIAVIDAVLERILGDRIH